MNKINRYNIITLLISVILFVLLLCVLTYSTAPESDKFQLESINPLDILEGTMFLFSYGFGVPLWLSVVILAVASMLIITLLFKAVRRIMR